MKKKEEEEGDRIKINIYTHIVITTDCNASSACLVRQNQDTLLKVNNDTVTELEAGERHELICSFQTGIFNGLESEGATRRVAL